MNPAAYCCLLTAWVALLYAFPLILAKTGVFERVTQQDIWDYAFQLHGKTADVVIYGDSTPLFDIDPAQVAALTGLSVINLPSSYSGMMNLGELPLDTYLANNERPKMLVLMLSPWSGAGAPTPIKYEVYLTLLKRTKLFDFLKMMLREPSAFQDIERQIMLDFTKALVGPRQHPTPLEEVTATRGHVTFNRRSPMKTTGLCVVAAGDPNDHRFIDHFTGKYRGLGYRVIVFIAPVPDCSEQFPRYRDALAGLADNQPHTLPTEWFADDGILVHGLAQAVPVVSRELAATLTKPLNNSGR